MCVLGALDVDETKKITEHLVGSMLMLQYHHRAHGRKGVVV